MSLTTAMRLRSALGSAAIAAMLLGCGGGGGGGMPQVQPPGPLPPPPPPPPTPTADSFRTAEYNRMGALDTVHAAEAYALGYTGAGVIVGVVDFNFQFGATDEINYHSASVGPNAQAIALYQAQTGTTVDSEPHGHAVAGIIGAKKNDTIVHGIAFEAQILAVDFFSNVNETVISQGGVQYHVSDPWTYITARGSKIINTSFGYDTGDIIPNPPAVSEAYTTVSPSVAVINGALLVSSAGNNGGPNPALSNLDIIDELILSNSLTNGPGAFIIAGSVNGNNQISSFSGRAGTARDHYMVAPGEDIGVLYMGALGVGSGTSFSAPLIAGAAALILDRWPSLTGRQVADILFQSATDLGSAGVDATYGHGLLNVEAALQPMGSSTVAVANGAAPALYATGMVLSPAFGDAPAFRASLAQVTILDGFGRDFTADASRAVYSRPNTPDLFGVMEQRFRWRGASYDLGQDAQFSYTVREDRADAINAFRALNGAEDIHAHETVFQFSGTRDEMRWSAGTGLSLRDAMSPRLADDPFTTASLTNAFTPMIGIGRGAFATARVNLGDDTGLSFGIAEDQVRETYAGAGFAPDSWSHSAAMRLDHRYGRSLFEFELGGLVEDGGVLGTLAAGGLKLSEQA
ncbi:MAG: S8 family serine peptidase, partial [Hyphomicrobium sp.]|nr:S8 family serine peptidase [Hyphomicrobium sp.]